jgi:hypothetical protein
MELKRDPWKIFLAAILLACSLTAMVRAQSAPATAEPQWANQDESDMGLAAQNEQDPAKKLQLLKRWEQQYPNSAFKNNRTAMTAFALLSVMGAAYGKPAGDPALTAGEKAAQDLESHFSEYFDDSVKPASATQDQWNSAKRTSEMQIHLVLAYIAQIQKDDARGEAECRNVLSIDPTQALCSYQLGAAIIHEMAVSQSFQRFSEALYDLARSLWVTGPNALPPPVKAAAEKALKANYPNYHGSSDGLDDLMKQVANSALPPASFHIPSAAEIEEAKKRDHDLWAQVHPELNFWATIRAALEAQGDAYFVPNLKDVELPPPVSDAYQGSPMFSGTVVSVPSSKQILVNIENVIGDALLKFDQNIKGDIPAGTAIQFRGVVDSYTKDPSYVLTFNIQEPKSDILGLPDGVTFVPDTTVKARPGGRSKTVANPPK